MITQTVTFIDRKPDTRILYMGNEDEHQCEAIRFKLPAWLEGAGVSLLLSIGNYSDVVGLGKDRVYRPTRTHMSRPGMWTGYITATMGEDLVWNSDTFQINIKDLPEFTEKIEQENPTILEDAIRILNTFTGMYARVENLEPGSEATVRLENDADGNRVLIFGIPSAMDNTGGASIVISHVDLLANNWVGSESPYSQRVTIEGVTPNSQVDLKPSIEQLAIFYDKDLAFVTENEDGVVTVYAIGDKPANDYTMQVSITEVIV